MYGTDEVSACPLLRFRSEKSKVPPCTWVPPETFDYILHGVIDEYRQLMHNKACPNRCRTNVCEVVRLGLCKRKKSGLCTLKNDKDGGLCIMAISNRSLLLQCTVSSSHQCKTALYPRC